MPNFHNPAGVTLAAERGRQILDICAAAGLLIVEDNPYGLLGFEGEPLRALRADDADGVVYLGSFSKTFASGVRVGWALAPPAVREKLVLAAESAVLCQSSLAQLLVREYLCTQPWREQVKIFRELYLQRRDAMLDALQVADAGRMRVDPPGGWLLCLAAGARRPRHQSDAATCGLVPGSPTFPVPGSTPTARGHSTSGCPTVCLNRPGSGKAFAVSPG